MDLATTVNQLQTTAPQMLMVTEALDSPMSWSSSTTGALARKQTHNVILPEVLVLPRPLFLLRHKDGGGLLLKKYTQGFGGKAVPKRPMR